jgi:hypothetical protein
VFGVHMDVVHHAPTTIQDMVCLIRVQDMCCNVLYLFKSKQLIEMAPCANINLTCTQSIREDHIVSLGSMSCDNMKPQCHINLIAIVRC